MYLAAILFSDDEKLLVTLDENIPIIEVDDNPPSTFLQDFCWLMKVSGSPYFDDCLCIVRYALKH